MLSGRGVGSDEGRGEKGAKDEEGGGGGAAAPLSPASTTTSSTLEARGSEGAGAEAPAVAGTSAASSRGRDTAGGVQAGRRGAALHLRP